MKNEATTNITVIFRCKYHHRTVREIPLGTNGEIKSVLCDVPGCGYLSVPRFLESKHLSDLTVAEQTESVPNEAAIRTVQRLLNRIDDLKDELVSLHKVNNAQIIKTDDLADDNARLRNVLDMIINVVDPSMEKHFGAPSDWLAQVREMAQGALEVKADER